MAGKVQTLADEIARRADGEGFARHAFSGIAHTRWATHGPPSVKNCHPHTDRSDTFAVVHNGVITNYAVLKTYLKSEGYLFQSDTDTEVIPALCQHIAAACPALSFKEVVIQAAQRLEGAFAIIVKNKLRPGELVAAKRGSPLIVGLQTDKDLPNTVSLSQPIALSPGTKIVLASDIAAILEHTNRVVRLEDNDVLYVANSELVLTNLGDAPLPQNRSVQLLSLKLEEIMKGGFDYFMEKEIFEQPDSVAQTLSGRVKLGPTLQPEVVLGGMLERLGDLLKCTRIVLIGCGSSFHACLSCRNTLERLTGKVVQCEVASDLLDRGALLGPSDACIFVSQSGETADTLQALRFAAASGCLCVGVTNVVGSSIARETHCGVHVNAGCEIGVASTKAYTSQIVVLVMIGMVLRGGSQKQAAECQKLAAALAALPEAIKQALDTKHQMWKIAHQLQQKGSVLLLGRGANYATALEGALKIKEVALVHSEGVLAGEMKHGPLALIDNALPVVVIATGDAHLAKMHIVIEQLRSRDSDLIVICHPNDAFLQSLRGPRVRLVEVPKTQEALQPVINIVPLQMLSFHTAVMRGLDVDQPRNLAKSVTVADG